MNSMRGCRFLVVGAALLALPACSTEEVYQGPAAIIDVEWSPSRSAFWVAFTPFGLTYDAQQMLFSSDASLVPCILRLDGQQVSYDAGGGVPGALFVDETATTRFGWLPPGLHHFEIASAGDGSSVFAGDAELRAGWQTWLYLFGDRGAVDGRFISYPEQPAEGMLHVGVINLVRDGRSIEVVSCDDAGACAPLAPALALGESFGADFPAGTADDTWYRVATAAVPSPPVRDLLPSNSTWPPPQRMAANFVAAPVYISPDGKILVVY
jgi:hypothetical protein